MARLRKTIVPIIILCMIIAGLIIATQDDQGTQATIPKTAKVDGPDKDAKRDDILRLNPSGVDVRGDAVDGEYPDLDGDMRGPDLAQAGVLSGPLAAQEWPGCKTAFVRSFSSRRGVEPGAIAYHYTAGPNRPGFADLDGLTAYSNNPRNEVSWHFGVDREGNCTYNVPVNQKAWTIAGLNSSTINFEIVGRGNEPDYAGTPGLKKVAQITKRISQLHGIPIRLGAVSECRVVRTGIITHWMGGACSGGHHDIKPYFIDQVIAKVKALSSSTSALPGPSPKPAWFWVALGEWLGGLRSGLEGPRPKPDWFFPAVAQWQATH